MVLKPGREEPWTPLRLIQAFVAAGAPPESVSFYPTDHEGAAAILQNCGRRIAIWRRQHDFALRQRSPHPDSRTGRSKIIIGADFFESGSLKPEHMQVLEDSIAANGGRSCVNASAVIVLGEGKGRAVAEELAKRLAKLSPRPASDPEARLSAFANPKMAEWIETTIEEGLKTPGAEDLTAKYRKGPRLVKLDGAQYLNPTVIFCDSFSHPLANKEFPVPVRKCRRNGS